MRYTVLQMGKEGHFIIISSAVPELLCPINTEKLFGSEATHFGHHQFPWAGMTMSVGIKLASWKDEADLLIFWERQLCESIPIYPDSRPILMSCPIFKSPGGTPTERTSGGWTVPCWLSWPSSYCRFTSTRLLQETFGPQVCIQSGTSL